MYFCTTFANPHSKIQPDMYKLILLVIVIIAFSACKKEESPNPVQPVVTPGNFPGPKAQVIISNQWKLTDKKIEYSNGLPTEDFTNVPSCQKDNVISFNRNKQYAVNESADMCPGNPQTITYNWSSDDQVIVLNNVKWNILSVDNTTLKMQNVNSSPFATVTTTETYTAQ